MRCVARMARCVAALALAISTAGCAPLRSLFTPADDYAAYRATRVAPTLDERIAAAARYLESFPDGDHAAEVRAYFEAAEPLFYASKKGSVAGLEAYMRALPRGTRSEDVIVSLRALRADRDRREELTDALSMGARLTALSAQRLRVRTELEAWIRRFLDLSVWARPLSEAPADVIIPWALALPAPVCEAPEEPTAGYARRCWKLLELPYTVTTDAGPEEREATIEIAVLEDAAGRPLRVTIGGPDLFVRLEETSSARAIDLEDAARRTTAASKSAELIERAVQKLLEPGPDCRRPPTSTILVHFACKGMRVSARRASQSDEDDVITITPL